MFTSDRTFDRAWKTLSPALVVVLGLSCLTYVGPVAASEAVPAARRAARGADLLRNATFRHDLEGWALTRFSAGTVTVNRSGRRGTRGAQLQGIRPGEIVLQNRRSNSAVDALAGDTLAATAWVRSERAGATVQIVVRGRSGLESTGGSSRTLRLLDTRWHPIATRLSVKARTSSALVSLRVDPVGGRGRVHVDDVHLRNPAVSSMTSAAFDGIRTGRISPRDFMRSLGGNNGNPDAYEDTFVASAGDTHGRVLRTRLEKGTIISSPAGNNGIVVLAPLSRPRQQACIRYQVRFDPSFDWSLGGKLPGLLGAAPGVSPAVASGGNYPGDKGWSGRLMWVGPRAYSWARPTNMAVSYMYGPRQQSQYGDMLQWHKAFRAGRWHTLMQCYTLNHVGQADGRLQAWIDGRVVVLRTSYVYRTRTDVQISHLAWSIFRGGNTMEWAGSRNNHIDIDNVLITTR